MTNQYQRVSEVKVGVYINERYPIFDIVKTYDKYCDSELTIDQKLFDRLEAADKEYYECQEIIDKLLQDKK